MKFHRLFFLLLSIIIILSCKKNTEEKHTLLSGNDEILIGEDKLNKVIITGVSDDTLALKFINLMNNSYLFSKDYHKTKRIIIKDSIYIEVDSIYKPQSFNLAIFGDSTLYSSRIFLTPGDTISFRIKNKTIHFSGNNSSYNNFFTLLDHNTADYGQSHYDGNIYAYKDSVKKIYKEKMKYLNEYLDNNQFPSEDQIDLIRDILKFEYLGNLSNPRSVYVKSANRYIQSSEGVIFEMNNEFKNNEQLFDLNDYFDGIRLRDFQRSDLLNNSTIFKNSLDSFIRYNFANSDYLNYSGEAFLAQKLFIKNNFAGDLEFYAIARLIREYNLRGFGYSIENIELLKSTISEYDSVFTSKPSYGKKMNEIKNSLESFNFELSFEDLNSKLINLKGDTLNMREIFKNSKDKIKVVDFWASWCPPCTREIAMAKSFRDKLSIENDVEFIYISIDTDRKKWSKKSKELKYFLNTPNQYLLVRGNNSHLAKSLRLKGVPRYVIFDKKERIILDNGPRPSDSLIFKKIINNIKD